MRSHLFVLILTLSVTVRPVHAAFEALPGPAAGSLNGWVGRSMPGMLPRNWEASASLGRPTSIDQLVWVHAAAGRTVRTLRFDLEGYQLSLEDLYSESVLGAWCKSPYLQVGLRHWRVGWEEGPLRSGWTGSALAFLRYGPISLQVALQDLPMGRRDVASPASRAAIESTFRIDTALDAAVRLHRSRDRDGIEGELAWYPLPIVGLRQSFDIPSERWMTGLDLGLGGLMLRMWTEPASAVGARVGLSLVAGRALWSG